MISSPAGEVPRNESTTRGPGGIGAVGTGPRHLDHLVSGDDYGSASGMYQAMQQIGGALGLALLVSIAGSHAQATIKVLPTSALEAGAALVILAFILTTVAFTGRSASDE
jgi:hypothetical protein